MFQVRNWAVCSSAFSPRWGDPARIVRDRVERFFIGMVTVGTVRYGIHLAGDELLSRDRAPQPRAVIQQLRERLADGFPIDAPKAIS